MQVHEAIDWVDAAKWRATPASERLSLLRQVQRAIADHADALIRADATMKGIPLDDPADAHQVAICAQTTIFPIAGNVAAAIELYEAIVDGRWIEPLAIVSVDGRRHDIQVSPRTEAERATFGARRDYLRTKGVPARRHPLARPGGIVAVLGAGNYSSAFEMIRAIFVDNCVVVHRPHHINAASDAIWEQVLAPLVAHRALAFCDIEGGRALAASERLSRIYFTGGTAAAQQIMRTASAELVSECGGNNPCLIVPGDRPWTDAEIAHQALQIASTAKYNGGAACGRVQTLVTCRRWPQRGVFLDALRSALRDGTPAMKTYYPGAERTHAAFAEACPGAERLHPEHGRVPSSEVLLITDVAPDGFPVSHEAFCQVLAEVPLDTPADCAAFLPAAVAFANDALLGSLGACILVDDDTLAAHAAAVDRAVTDLAYGGVAVNNMPATVWFNPALTWGGNEEGRPFCSGRGNFGNLLGYEDIEKSIVRDTFMAPGHLMITDKRAFAATTAALVDFTIFPTPANLAKVGAAAQAAAGGGH